MRINRIELKNIGSYEGINEFDILKQNTEGNIVVIGGKNGAGKTTLFSAIKVCLYGYKEAGYESFNAFYKKSIKKMINDKAKAESDGSAYVVLDLDITNGLGWDNYVLKREWSIENESFEVFRVHRNGRALESDEIYDFENFLMNIIPPELFELYFFDGEQIADFFLADSGNERIKNAFLTICGYDTFSIIYKNFKRLAKNNIGDSNVVSFYFEMEEKRKEAETQKADIEKRLQEVLDAIELENSRIRGIEERFRVSGGISKEEWDRINVEIKNEERFREDKNGALKNAANEVIPFLILSDELQKLLEQMQKEQETEKKDILKETMLDVVPKVLNEIGTDLLPREVQDDIIERLSDRLFDDEDVRCYLNLSKTEYLQLSSMMAKLMSCRKTDVLALRREIKNSIIRTQGLRDKIDQTNGIGIEEYLSEKQNALDNKMTLVNQREELLIQSKEVSDRVDELVLTTKKAEKDLEKVLKSESLSSLTAKSVVFLEALQSRLFRTEVEKVEKLFMQKMQQLRRKEKFIDSIEIDDSFNVKLYKLLHLDLGKLCDKLEAVGEDAFIKEFGKESCERLLNSLNINNICDFVAKYRNTHVEHDMKVEFDKSIMSKGEKQVFIMALYWAIMQLCNKVVPFIIDTPFARIDTEHREHITEFFFKELKGQVFIFSTDEEITQEHLAVIGDKLQAKFLIENVDNTKTVIHNNRYFEVQ